MSETLTIEGLLTDYARCLKAYFEEGCHDEVYENQGKAGNAIVAHATTLVNRIAELEAMLSRLEWIIPGRYTPGDFCPICDNDTGWGHTDDCELGALLHKE